jgi:transposase
MRITSPFAVTLTESDTEILTATIRRSTAVMREVLRAQIVLLAADGMANAQIAWTLGVCVDTARKWRRRFTERGLAGLRDRERSGRPPTCTPVQVAAVKALACEPPERHGLNLTRWSSAELAKTVVAQQILATVSTSTVRRWPPTRCSSGVNNAGSSPATQNSRPKPAACWTCMKAPRFACC